MAEITYVKMIAISLESKTKTDLNSFTAARVEGLFKDLAEYLELSNSIRIMVREI